MTTRGVLLAIAVLLLTGCSSAAKPAPAPSVSPIAACVSADEQRTGGVQLPAGGGRHADAVIVGTGTTGVVLANQSDGDLCGWKGTYGDYLSKQGYRVLLFNYSGTDPGKDVVAAVDALRGKGVQKVFLIGASMGGTSVLYAAAHATPPVAGVVDLSGPRVYSGIDAAAAVRTLTTPALFVAGQFDGGFAADTQELYTACTATDKKLDIEPNGAHGWELLDDKVAGLVETFLKNH